MKIDNKMLEAGKKLKDVLGLRYEPIAIRYAETMVEIPENAIRPYRDKKVHYAMCQILTMVKTQGDVYAMTLEDHWCWKPPIGAGMVQVEEGSEAWDIALKNCGVKDAVKAAQNFRELPKLPYQSCKAILIGPLSKANYTPDVILVYCHKASHINWLIGGAKYESGKRISVENDYIDSCLWSTIPTKLTGDMKITFPDPGELDRAACPEDEVIVSIAPEAFTEIANMAAEKLLKQRSRLKKDDGTPKMESAMVPDFPRPEFYTKLYELWGLDSSGNVIWTEKDR